MSFSTNLIACLFLLTLFESFSSSPSSSSSSSSSSSYSSVLDLNKGSDLVDYLIESDDQFSDSQKPISSYEGDEENLGQEDDTNQYDSFKDDDSYYGLCVESTSCINRDGEDILQPRRKICPDDRIFCPLDDLVEDYPRCGISRQNLFHERITSGGKTAMHGEWPWMAIILEQVDGQILYRCSAVLIDNQHLLTVAHCIEKFKYSDLIVRLGEHDLRNAHKSLPSIDISPEAIIFHPSYKRSNLHNDVALIRLPQAIKQTRHISPICLPSASIDVRHLYRSSQADQCVVTGWGKQSSSSKLHSPILKTAYLSLVESSHCQKQLRRTKLGKHFKLFQGFLCAGGERDVDACQGDGGSPLACPQEDGSYVLMGLVSWGIGCGREGVPGVYTNVPFYDDFIRENIEAFD